MRTKGLRPGATALHRLPRRAISSRGEDGHKARGPVSLAVASPTMRSRAEGEQGAMVTGILSVVCWWQALPGAWGMKPGRACHQHTTAAEV